MNKNYPLISAVLVAFGFASLSGSAFAQQPGAKPTGIKPVKPAVQKATVIIDGGYSPASLTVKAGRPVELTFVRKSATGCDDELLIPGLKFDKKLKQGEKAVVRFTPTTPQTLAFTCGMKMYKGQIVVK